MDGKERSLRGQRVLDRIERLGKPVVAAVNGFALGGGCELALACHVRVASENAKLGTPEVKLGIMCGYAGTQRLPRLVGKGRALEMLLTGEMVDAAEALRIGLVNRVVPREKLLAEAEALLRKMLANGPVSLRFTLEAVNDGLEMRLRRGPAPGGHALRPHLHDRRHEGGHQGLPREAAGAVPGQVSAKASRPSAPADARGLRVVLLRSRFNAAVVDGLLAGAREALREMGARERGRHAWSTCPGAFELPLAARGGRALGRFDAIVALGAVIRGETDHYEHIAREAAAGLAAVARESGVPVGFGVLTVARGGAGARARRRRPREQGRGGGAGGGGHGAPAAIAAARRRAPAAARGRAAAAGSFRSEGSMGKRTKARECALQMLYQWDITREPMDRVAGLFWQVRTSTDETRAMAERLARGAQARGGRGSTRTSPRASHNWRFDRIAAVDQQHPAPRRLRADAGAGHAVVGGHRRGGGAGQAVRRGGLARLRERRARRDQGARARASRRGKRARAATGGGQEGEGQPHE